MPIPAPGGLTADVGMSIDGSTTWLLQFRYDNFCTQFTHDGTSQNFTGYARLAGSALMISGGTTTSILGPAPTISLTVGSALYTVSNGTTHPYFYLQGLALSQPYSTFTPNYISLDATFAAQSISFVGPNSIEGLIYGNIMSGGDQLGSGNVLINMTRGGSCPI